MANTKKAKGKKTKKQAAEQSRVVQSRAVLIITVAAVRKLHTIAQHQRIMGQFVDQGQARLCLRECTY